MSFHGQPFWFFMTVAVLVWYSTVTVYVAVKGLLDIRDMFKRLRAEAGRPTEQAANAPKSETAP